MQPLKVNLHWKMKDMRVEVKISTYPLLPDKLPEPTMFPVITTSPLMLLVHVAWVPASHAVNLYDTGYHLDDEDSLAVVIASIKVTTPPQNPMGFTQQPHSKCILTIHDDREKKKKIPDCNTR